MKILFSHCQELDHNRHYEKHSPRWLRTRSGLVAANESGGFGVRFGLLLYWQNLQGRTYRAALYARWRMHSLHAHENGGAGWARVHRHHAQGAGKFCSSERSEVWRKNLCAAETVSTWSLAALGGLHKLRGVRSNSAGTRQGEAFGCAHKKAVRSICDRSRRLIRGSRARLRYLSQGICASAGNAYRPLPFDAAHSRLAMFEMQSRHRPFCGSSGRNASGGGVRPC